MIKELRKAYQVYKEISELSSEINELYNRSQWAPSSALDLFDDAISKLQIKKNELYKELEEIEAQ